MAASKRKTDLKKAGMKFVGETERADVPEGSLSVFLKPDTSARLLEFCQQHHDANPDTVIDRAVLAFIGHK